METSYELHFLLLYLSLGLGIFLGLVYDVFKLFRLLTGAGKFVVFVEDILFCAFCGVCFSVVFYNASRGAMRLYAFLAAIATFSLYYFTVGRLTEKAARKVVSVVRPRLYRAKKALLCRMAAQPRRRSGGAAAEKGWGRMARQRANIIVRLAVLCVAVFLVFSAVNMQFRLGELRESKAQLEEEIAVLEDRLIYMQLRLDEPVTDEYIRRIAREKLNYRDPDEILFYNDLAD